MTCNLQTKYLGLSLANPLVVSACPLTDHVETVKRLVDAGAAAIVLPSLFQEQVEHGELELQNWQMYGSDSFPEALNYFPALDRYNNGGELYLQKIEDARHAVSVPVIASLNGVSKSGWERFATRMEQAGASALELNIYFVPTDPDATSDDVETRYIDLVAAVRNAVKIPLAVKIGPYFSSLPNMARRLVEAGADGLVLFNRFLQPDINLESLQVAPNLVLSTSDELRLPLRWTAILRGQTEASIAITSGVHTAFDVLKALLAGADVTMMASALLKHGPEHLRRVLSEVETWLIEHEYESVQQMQGSLSQRNCPNPDSFERANYMHTLVSYSTPAP